MCEKKSFAKTGIYFLACIGVGCICTTLCFGLFTGFNDVVKSYLFWMIASVLFGVISKVCFRECGGSLPGRTVIHCILCLAVTLVTAYLTDCFAAPGTVIGIVVTFLVIYGVIYIICYISSKTEADRLNKKLEEK